MTKMTLNAKFSLTKQARFEQFWRVMALPEFQISRSDVTGKEPFVQPATILVGNGIPMLRAAKQER